MRGKGNAILLMNRRLILPRSVFCTQLLQHDKVAAAAGIKPDNAAGKTAGVPLEDSTGLLESSGGQGEAGQGSQAQQQRQAEVLSLRRRGTELEESLTAARTGRAAARARREFMKEEAEQVNACSCFSRQEHGRQKREASSPACRSPNPCAGLVPAPYLPSTAPPRHPVNTTA